MLVLSGVNLSKPQPLCNRQPLPRRQKQLGISGGRPAPEWTLPGEGHCARTALGCPASLPGWLLCAPPDLQPVEAGEWRLLRVTDSSFLTTAPGASCASRSWAEGRARCCCAGGCWHAESQAVIPEGETSVGSNFPK